MKLALLIWTSCWWSPLPMRRRQGMKERIGAAIQKQLLEHPMSEHLYRQSMLLQKAQITTLHAFLSGFGAAEFFSGWAWTHN